MLSAMTPNATSTRVAAKVTSKGTGGPPLSPSAVAVAVGLAAPLVLAVAAAHSAVNALFPTLMVIRCGSPLLFFGMATSVAIFPALFSSSLAMGSASKNTSTSAPGLSKPAALSVTTSPGWATSGMVVHAGNVGGVI